MDSRYTNREKYLDGLSDDDIAVMIERTTLFKTCEEYCPIKDCDHKRKDCEKRISKWLGEYSND